MSATVRIAKIDFAGLAAVPANVMKDAGDLAARMIRTRTQQGKDKDGQPFVAYTPDYSERKAKELGAGPVNLTVSGRMLNDMGVSESGINRVSIGFRSSGGTAPRGTQTLIQRSRAVGAEDKARWHDRDGAGKSKVKRPFLGLTDEESGRIKAAIETYLGLSLIHI